MSQNINSKLQQAEPNKSLKLPESQTFQDSSLNVYAYHTEAIPVILELTRETLGNSGAVRKTEVFWRWKHEDNPFGSSYGLYVWDEAKNMAAGLRVLMRWRFNGSAGGQLQAVRAVDTATHPAYQRQGIFSTLTRQAVAELTEAGVHLIFNTPNKRSLPGYLKMGWQVVTAWPVYVRVIKPFSLVTRLIQRNNPMAGLPPFEQYFKQEVMRWGAFVQRYQSEIPTLLAKWEQNRVRVGLRTPRELAYLQWRYGQHPHLQYGVFPLEQEGGLGGFAILRPNIRFGLKEIVLAELFLQTPDPTLGRHFMKRLYRQLKGDYLVAHFAQNSLEKKLLSRSGFLRAPRQGMVFTVRPLNVSCQDVLQPDAWDLSLGDLELF